jgi:hypothetical protein
MLISTLHIIEKTPRARVILAGLHVVRLSDLDYLDDDPAKDPIQGHQI